MTRQRGVALAVVAAMCLAATWPAGSESDAPWGRSTLGVEIQDVKAGTGDTVVPRAEVEVHYVGMLEDGTVFDESRPRGAPFSFRVGAGLVIQGWDDGLVGMKVGGVRRLVVPPELGYGDEGAGRIPPGATLYFEVEMLGVEPPRVPPPSPAGVGADAWREVRGWEVAEVSEGSGRRLRVRKGERACLDFAKFDGENGLVAHTYDRAGCTWYRLAIEDVPGGFDGGLHGMRAGGTRLVRGDGLVWQVRVEEVGQ